MVLSRLVGGEVNWVNQLVSTRSEVTTLPTRYGVSRIAASGCHCTRKEPTFIHLNVEK